MAETKKTTTAPAATTAPASAEPAKVAPAKLVDLAALAAQAKQIEVLPKMVVGGHQSTNPFAELVRKSAESNKPFTTPAVPEAQGLRVQDAIWRAANGQGLTVKTRRVKLDGGMVEVAFQATKKK